VFANGEVFYADDKVGFLVLGNIIDTQSRQNVTEARLNKLTAIKFDDLPFAQAIKLVRGNGARRLAVFEDPNCGYCKRFEQDLNSLENITAYIFPYPILAADSAEKSKAIWCSSDKLKAWQDLMLRGQSPTAKTTCDNPIDKIIALGQKLRITGTPLTFFEDGERIPGALPKERLEAKLIAVAAAGAKVGAK
jgi:thiol:disulfide interchange protein DsbC